MHFFDKHFILVRNLVQALFMALFNLDFITFYNSIKFQKAMVSQSPLKRFCVPALNCYSCPSAIGACPIGSLQFWLNDTALKINLQEKINFAGLYIMGFLALVGVTVGRLCCGFVCPFGLLQDLIGKFTKLNYKIPKFIRYLRYVVLVLFVIVLPFFFLDIRVLSPWFCKLLCPAGTFQAGIPLLAIDEGLRKASGVITITKFSILFLFLFLFLISKRAFCKVMCPLGAIWGLFNRVSLLKLKLDTVTCNRCRKCETHCPMNVEILKNPNSVECIRCMECIKVCPNKSLSSILTVNLINISERDSNG